MIGTILLACFVTLAIIFAIRWHTVESPPRSPKSGVTTRQAHLTLKQVRARQKVKQLYLRRFGLLPPEVVHQIFTLCLPQTPFIRPKPTDAPLLLCQVSRTWRKHALSNPEMWASLYVRCWSSGKGIKPCRQSIHPELMRRWMKCSSTLPISLHLSLGKKYYQRRDGRDAFRTIAQTMASEVGRCKNLELDLPAIEAIDAFFVTLPRDEVLPLESLLVRCEDGNKLPTRLHVLFDFSPALRNLIWKSPNVRGARFLPIVNWVQLVDLRLDCRLSMEDCFHIIQKSTQLKICYLFGISRPTLFAPLTGPYIHTTLQDLRLHSTIPINSLVSAFTLPCLDTLHLIFSEEPVALSAHHSGPDILHLVLRSRPPLRSLTLESFRIPEDYLIQCLLKLPTIEEIKIDEKATGFLTDKFLDALGRFWPTSESEEGGSAPRLTFLCPKLQAIRLGPNISSTDGVFADMFRKRWNAAGNGEVSRPKSIQVEFRNGPHLADEGIKRYRAEGLSFHFFSTLDVEV